MENKVITIDKEIKIGRNEECPCGSGKKFKNCCDNKNHIYKLYSYNYKSEEIIYDKNENDFWYEEFGSYYNKVMNIDWNSKSNKYDELELLRELYYITDNLINPFLIKSSCTEGCNVCCSLIVETTAIEAELIKEYIDDRFTRKEKKELLKKVRYFKDEYPKPIEDDMSYPEDTLDKYFKNNNKCIFNQDDGLCSIYEVRPYMCRKHFVFNHPKDCEYGSDKERTYRSSCFKYIFMILNKLSRDVLNIHEVRHLPAWFLKYRKLHI